MSPSQGIQIHKDHLSAEELDLQDPHVTSSVSLFAIHNVIRRNLSSCSQHAKVVNTQNFPPYLTYAKYTLHVTTDQLDSVDKIWFPVFAEYDPGFQAEIVAHEPLREQITALQDLLSVMTSAEKVEESLPKIAEGFAHLRSQISAQYDIEEDLVCSLGKKVPIDRIRGMEKLQEERRKSDVKTYGHLWTAVYLLRGLNPKERAIFSPGIPKFVAGGMLTAGAMQFRRELQFTPKF